MIALLLMLQIAFTSRPYHRETVASLAACRHTHVVVSGKVTLVRHEADGDWHIRVSDGLRFIVAEIVPTLVPLGRLALQEDQLSIEPPKVGQCVRVRGIRRFDNEVGHGWSEIHPVEQLEVIACRAAMLRSSLPGTGLPLLLVLPRR